MTRNQLKSWVGPVLLGSTIGTTFNLAMGVGVVPSILGGVLTIPIMLGVVTLLGVIFGKEY